MNNISKARKILFIILGLFFTGVGVLGMFLPVLPTTVFLLIAAWFFLRSSPALHRRLNDNRFTGPYIKAYTEKRGLSRRRKISTIAFLWLSLGVSAYFVRETTWLLALLGAVGIGVTIHVATIRARVVSPEVSSLETAPQSSETLL